MTVAGPSRIAPRLPVRRVIVPSLTALRATGLRVPSRSLTSHGPRGRVRRETVRSSHVRPGIVPSSRDRLRRVPRAALTVLARRGPGVPLATAPRVRLRRVRVATALPSVLRETGRRSVQPGIVLRRDVRLCRDPGGTVHSRLVRVPRRARVEISVPVPRVARAVRRLAGRHLVAPRAALTGQSRRRVAATPGPAARWTPMASRT